ncbi:DUF423 domain-containing protein [Faucicola mancuniensis]|uniref:DUF423 domain-containing protein n=1 Tax=Faucicola mancuniensis TaxID=1309795 RepID=UPI0039776E9E
MNVNWLSIGAINLAIAVACGAFGSHGLKARLTAEQLNWWQTGTQYFFYHALGLLIVGLLIKLKFAPAKIAWVLQFGIVFFVGSLYLMALGFPRWLGAITPIGGTLFIIAWVWLAVVLAKVKG